MSPPSNPQSDPQSDRRRPGTGASSDVEAFVVCAPGTEPLLDAELAALGVKRRRVDRGGVEARLRQRQLYAANVWSRVATRVLVRLGTFDARTFDEFRDGVASLPWHAVVPEGAAVSVRASAHRSRLTHTGALAERFADELDAPLVSLGDADRRDDEDDGDGTVARFVVRIDRDRCTVSVDSSGQPLYHRGWRRAVGKAPIRPTVAGAMLATLGWSASRAGRRRLLVDPFCGSGTIPIEAALAGAGRPPGSGRRFAFEDWEDFAPGTLASVKALAPGPAATITEPPARDHATADVHLRCWASDRDAGAVEATNANAGRAGVHPLLDTTVRPISALDLPTDVAVGPDDMAWIVTNPPWGGRVGGADLRDLYASFGQTVRDRFEGWRVAMLVADRHLAAHTGLPLRDSVETPWGTTTPLSLTSGGVPVQLLVTDVLRRGADAARPTRARRGSPPRRRG